MFLFNKYAWETVEKSNHKPLKEKGKRKICKQNVTKIVCQLFCCNMIMYTAKPKPLWVAFTSQILLIKVVKCLHGATKACQWKLSPFTPSCVILKHIRNVFSFKTKDYFFLNLIQIRSGFLSMNFWSIDIFVKEHPDVKDLQRRDRNLLGFLNSKIVLQRHEGE